MSSNYELFNGSILPTSSPQPLLQAPGNENGEAQSCRKSPTFDVIFLGKRYRWDLMLITQYMLVIYIDTFFLYIPYTSGERKCIGRNYRVQNVALVFRSVIDIIFLAQIVYQLQVAIKFGLSVVTKDEIYESVTRKQMGQFITGFSDKLSWRLFLTDLLGILPVPQVLIVGWFFKIGGTDYLNKIMFVNGFVILQFASRVYRIYLSFSQLLKSKVGGIIINLYLYVLASLALGAFWYFFSIQRQITCWYQNCVDANHKASLCTFYCHEDTTAALITQQFNATLNEQCLLKIPNNMTDPPFDFGIFFDLLKNDMQGNINFGQKVAYCFWWGLRNWSNFGTSLMTSTYVWENIFAVFVSIVGLLLFLYLIGNVQELMEGATTKKEVVRKEEARLEFQNKSEEIGNWMQDLGLDDDIKEAITLHIMKKMEEDTSVNLDDLYPLLPNYIKKIVKRVVGMKTLRRVPILTDIDVRVLKLMCDHMKLENYQAGKIIFEKRDPLDRMVFVTNGIMYQPNGDHSNNGSPPPAGEAATTIRQSGSTDAFVLKKGECYGLELLQYASSNTNQLPTLYETVKCETMVEVLVLTATDLRTIAILCRDNGLWPSSFANLQEDAVAPLPEIFQQQQQQQSHE